MSKKLTSSKMMGLLLVLVIALVSTVQGQYSCQHNGTIRLQDGLTDFDGRVEICMGGQWQTVCNDFWGHNDALVACRQLGFSTSGIQSFIDLRMTGGPNTGIDNINCTGSEQRLLDCRLSTETSDCNSDSHKVGVRCHEERKPENVMLSSDETVLNVVWDVPKAGATNEPVQSYDIEYFYTQENRNYSLKHSVNSSTIKASFPAINAFSDSSHHECCVEAIFDTYSSIACASLPPVTIDVSTGRTQQVQGNRCSSDATVQIVAGVLTTIIIFLLTLLVIAIGLLVYTFIKLKKRMHMHKSEQTVASNRRKKGQLGNPMYGKQEVNDLTSRGKAHSNTTLGNGHSYSSIGQEYETVQSAQQTGRNCQSSQEMHSSANLNNFVMFQPAPYEVPVNSGTLTLS